MATAVGQALDQLFNQLRAGQATVTANGNVRFILGQALGTDGATEPVSRFGVEKFRDGAAYVIGAENAVGELGGNAHWGAHLG
ncbi:hypothetical protein D3C78_1866870 [compost metagenome]